MKPSLISVLSEQSMLGVNIGRVDWFFILFAEIGTILSAGACLFFAKKSLAFAFPKIKEIWLLVGLIVVIYFVDIFYLVDVHTQKQLFIDYMKYVALAVKALSVAVLMILCVFKTNKNSEKNNAENLAKIKTQRQVKKCEE